MWLELNHWKGQRESSMCSRAAGSPTLDTTESRPSPKFPRDRSRGGNPSLREVQGEEENSLERGNGNTPLLQDSSVSACLRCLLIIHFEEKHWPRHCGNWAIQRCIFTKWVHTLAHSVPLRGRSTRCHSDFGKEESENQIMGSDWLHLTNWWVDEPRSQVSEAGAFLRPNKNKVAVRGRRTGGRKVGIASLNPNKNMKNMTGIWHV